jgi:hypothetical protein
MLPGAAMQKQVGTGFVDCLRDVHVACRDMVELLLTQFDQPGLVVGDLAGDAVLFAHDGLQCCAGGTQRHEKPFSAVHRPCDAAHFADANTPAAVFFGDLVLTALESKRPPTEAASPGSTDRP